MNATDRITSDLTSPPADGLDLVIDALDRVIPVFDDRQLHLGTNTRYISANARLLSSIAQETALATQNTRRKKILPAIPQFFRLKEVALKAAGEIDSLQRQEWANDNVNANGRRYLAGISKGHIRGLLNSITSLESHWGSFQIWAKQPKRILCRSLIQAWQKGESDSEEFLPWFREHELGVLGPELDPYIAQVLLGMRVSRGEILLPGDLQNLARWDEHEIYAAIERQARGRKLEEQRAHFYNESGRLDPVARACELNPLFPAPEQLRSLSSMQLAFIREKLRATGKRAGLTKEHADFLARMALDGAKQQDNPAAWRAIRDRKRESLLPKVQKILGSIPREP